MADSKKYNGSTWQHSLRKLGTSTDTLTTLPADVYADGNSATVGLVGDMSQTGTPTPQNPITPSETGERTANLFNKDATDTSNGYIANRYLVSSGDITSSSLYAISEYIEVEPNTVYTFFNGNAPNSPAICFYDSSKSYLEGTAYNGFDTVTVTSPSSAKYCRVSFAKSYDNVAMLNSGSTPLPYQPYGYKLDIKSANTTTPVYLGQVQTERKIKKLVLTGQENWGYSVLDDKARVYNDPIAVAMPSSIAISSHYPYQDTNLGYPDIGKFTFNATKSIIIGLNPNEYTSASDFKTYLAQQYAAGTPVCVWYVLATPQTAVVNEPIRKIGDYADTVSGITIPTITGADSFDVLTTLKPSEVSLNYTGWHDATVEEWDGSQWQ